MGIKGRRLRPSLNRQANPAGTMNMRMKDAARGIQRNLPVEPYMQANPEFWLLVDVRSDTDCWPWLGRISNSGHGEYGKNATAHRHAFEAKYGPVPAGLEVCHDCHNPSCGNPAHLRADSHRSNMIEMGERRRGKPARVLNEVMVRTARVLHAAGKTIIAIAREFGVLARTLALAVQGKTWKWVEA